MIYPGLLARYDQMDLLSRLSQKVGRDNGIPGLWLLLPGSTQALIDGKAVPLLGPGQRALVPEGWLRNVHRGGQSAVSGQQSAVSSQQSAVSGQRSAVSDQRSAGGER